MKGGAGGCGGCCMTWRRLGQWAGLTLSAAPRHLGSLHPALGCSRCFLLQPSLHHPPLSRPAQLPLTTAARLAQPPATKLTGVRQGVAAGRLLPVRLLLIRNSASLLQIMLGSCTAALSPTSMLTACRCAPPPRVVMLRPWRPRPQLRRRTQRPTWLRAQGQPPDGPPRPPPLQQQVRPRPTLVG